MMETSESSTVCPNEAIADLEQELSQARAEIERLKQVQAQERTQREQVGVELRTSRQLLQLVMDTLPEAIFWKDHDLVYLGCNQNFAEDAGLSSPQEIVGKTDFDLPWKTEEAEFYRECDRRVMLTDQAEFGIIEPQLNAEGKQTWLETNKAPLHDSSGRVIGMLGTYLDITERRQSEISLQELNQKLELQAIELTATLEQLQQSQLQLIQREKMSALGSLVAGVAHEINNPLSFLSGNLNPAQGYVKDLFEILDLYHQEIPHPTQAIQKQIEAIDLEFLREDLPKLLCSMREAVKRIANISISLRTFSRSDTEYQMPFQLHEGLDSTLLILKHRLRANEHRPEIQVIQSYGEMPLVRCFPGQLNQVFMNLLANAIDALEESNHGKSYTEIQAQPNCIEIATQLSMDQQWAIVTIKDNGTGMTDEVKYKMFENLFTTKSVGKGTGLGLAIARQIIVENHGGTIAVDSSVGWGTEFILKIPVGEN
ncbi:MAG: ATP-binding protein [Cyanobacteria bacterium J06638_22]